MTARITEGQGPGDHSAPLHIPAGSAVVISLGGNMGDRRLYLRRAIEALATRLRIVRISSLFETEPVDAPAGSGLFLNLAIACIAHQAPHDLLKELKEIERRSGRLVGRRNAPRPVDLDIILHEGPMIRSLSLQVPHPRFAKREFVLAPLREIVPNWIDPESGARVEAMRGEGRVRSAGRLY